MEKWLLLLIVLFVHGCASTAPESTELDSTALRHETSESVLLTEAEFMDRVTQSADLIYEGLRAINDAVNQYFIDSNGSLPRGSNQLRDLLLDGGYLEEWPVVPPFAFTDPGQGHFKNFRGYADMDGLGTLEDVTTVMELKNEVCQDFVRRYASPGFGDTIYDMEAAGEKYPGETISGHIKVYAVRWLTDAVDHCDILWVMEYTGFTAKQPPFPGPIPMAQ
jgi:hypothetical protein